jgi:hypothetical protein
LTFSQKLGIRSPSPVKSQKVQANKLLADRVKSFVLTDERAYADP